MTYPGMAFVFIVGVGLATILYYMFADSNNSHEHSSHGSNGSGGPPPDISNSWSVSNNKQRRKGSNAIDMINDCTICLGEISVQQCVSIQPCGHSFHKQCIQNWQQQGVMDIPTCPNCRRKIDKIY